MRDYQTWPSILWTSLVVDITTNFHACVTPCLHHQLAHVYNCYNLRIRDTSWLKDSPLFRGFNEVCGTQEKIDALKVLGADVRPVPAVPFDNPDNYNHQVHTTIRQPEIFLVLRNTFFFNFWLALNGSHILFAHFVGHRVKYVVKISFTSPLNFKNMHGYCWTVCCTFAIRRYCLVCQDGVIFSAHVLAIYKLSKLLALWFDWLRLAAMPSLWRMQSGQTSLTTLLTGELTLRPPAPRFGSRLVCVCVCVCVCVTISHLWLHYNGSYGMKHKRRSKLAIAVLLCKSVSY